MRKITIALAALALAVSTTPARAVPGAAAGALATSNVDFVMNLPDVPAIGARIVGTTMYVTTSQGLRIFDVSLGIPVPIGALELPHFENENVSTNGKILLISADSGVSFPSNVLYVIDVSIPQAPLLKGVTFPPTGHTATCILDCRYAWVVGSGRGIAVVDLADPSNPRLVGKFGQNAHNVDVDAAGIAWVSASGSGLYAYDVTPARYGPGNPLNPTLVAQRGTGPAPGFHNKFIIHNSLRPDAALATPAKLADGAIDPGEVVLVTEENWMALGNGLCADDGQFQTGWFHTVNGKAQIDRIGQFSIGQGSVTQGEKPAGVVACSSHWFDERAGVVADAWYEQGVRFLDVSDPRNVRQIGYFMPLVTEVWQALFNEVASGPTAGLYVYTFDAARGLDVLKFTGVAGDPTQLAPRINTPAFTFSAPSPEWGYACRIFGMPTPVA